MGHSVLDLMRKYSPVSVSTDRHMLSAASYGELRAPSLAANSGTVALQSTKYQFRHGVAEGRTG